MTYAVGFALVFFAGFVSGCGTPERPQMRVSVQYCLRHAGVFRAVFSLDDTSVIMVCNDGSLQPYIGQYTETPR